MSALAVTHDVTHPSSVWRNVARPTYNENMTERRVISSPDVACPDCGHDEAIVRARGNAFASTCTSCRRVDLRPLLTGELLDVFDTHAPVHVRSLFAAEHAALDDVPPPSRVSVRFTIPSTS